MTTIRRLILAILILLAGGIAFDVWRRPGPAGGQATTSAAPREPAQTPSIWTGSPSCIGRSCHGGLEPRTDGYCLQNEFTTISTQDPHARAYRVLFDKRSQDMVRALGYQDGKAHEVTRCLACHATPLTVAASGTINGRERHAPPPMRTAEVAFGVGCESCHGPAAGWIDRHYVAGYKNARPAEGHSNPTALSDPAVRAATCASCHVGAPATSEHPQRNVDHDLIAAGHPRLLFEFVSLQKAMPAHWWTNEDDMRESWEWTDEVFGEGKDRRPRIDGEQGENERMKKMAPSRPKKWKRKPEEAAFEWFVGQIEGARASLRLLRQRADAPNDPWPEFAEFDCFACHHDLRAKSWRQRVGGKRPPGELPWDSWNYAVIVRLLKRHRLPTDGWRELRETMARLDPDRKLALGPLRKAEESLDRLAKESDHWRGGNGVKSLLNLVENSDWASAESWEAAEQYYFAMRVLVSASADQEPVRWARLASRLAELEERRGFESEYVSPRRFDPREFFRR